MGGLLDKANATKDADADEKTAEPKPVVVSATAKDTPSHKTSNALSPAGSPDTATKINLAGWVIVLLGAILSLQGGAWGFAVVAVVLVVGIGAIVQADRMRGSVNKPKLYGSVVVALLIATTPYAAVMLVPTNASMAISEVNWMRRPTNSRSRSVAPCPPSTSRLKPMALRCGPVQEMSAMT
jgi:hypothetical protein